MKSHKIAFIFSQFPCYDETFILREMNGLKDTGLEFEIYFLKTPKDKIIHEVQIWGIKAEGVLKKNSPQKKWPGIQNGCIWSCLKNRDTATYLKLY